MSQRGPFPTEDAKFNQYLERAIPHLLENWEKLVPSMPGTPDERKEELEDLFKDWNETYPLSQNPDTRTTTITGEKDALRDEIETLMRNIYDDIPASWLNPSDREVLNIHLRDREPSPHPHIVDPIIGLTPLTGGEVEVRVRVTTDSTNASKPLDHILVQAQYALTDASSMTAPAFEQCTLQYQSSHALSIMQLGITNVGKKFYGYFRWYDPIHPEDSGPWTQAQSVIVA